MPQLDLSKGKVPAKACRFTADVTVGAVEGDGKVTPIKLTARTGQPVENYWWGPVVHDMGGFRAAKPVIPLDYCHDDEQVIGYADAFDTSTGDLVASGALVPYPNNPEDKAAEVIYKAGAGKGVPYQASIFFDGPLVVEDVGPGATANVNGYSIEGPATIIRQWTLRGIAICPYGVDGDTSVEMKFAKDREIPVRVLSKENPMSTEQNGSQPAADATKPAAASTETAATENKPAEAVTDSAASGASEQPSTAAETDNKPADELAKPETAETTENEPVAAGAMGVRKAEGKKFRDAFGDKGPGYFADGLSFEEAMTAYVKDLAADNKRLSAEVAELKKLNAGLRGETDPVSFSADPTEKPPVAAGQQAANADPRHKNLGGGGLTKFADSIKFQQNGAALAK